MPVSLSAPWLEGGALSWTRAVSVFKVPAHADVDAVLTSDVPREAIVGNYVADAVADRGAKMASVSPSAPRLARGEPSHGLGPPPGRPLAGPRPGGPKAPTRRGLLLLLLLLYDVLYVISYCCYYHYYNCYYLCIYY